MMKNEMKSKAIYLFGVELYVRCLQECCMLCFVLMNSIILNFLCVWIWFQIFSLFFFSQMKSFQEECDSVFYTIYIQSKHFPSNQTTL